MIFRMLSLFVVAGDGPGVLAGIVFGRGFDLEMRLSVDIGRDVPGGTAAKSDGLCRRNPVEY